MWLFRRQPRGIAFVPAASLVTTITSLYGGFSRELNTFLSLAHIYKYIYMRARLRHHGLLFHSSTRNSQTPNMLIRILWVAFVGASTALPPPTTGYSSGSHQIDFVSTAINLGEKGFTNDSTFSGLSKRWDGSPAMGSEYAKAKNKGCNLWAMMHSDDANAGKLFDPPRDLAHSDYLQLDGMACTPASNSD